LGAILEKRKAPLSTDDGDCGSCITKKVPLLFKYLHQMRKLLSFRVSSISKIRGISAACLVQPLKACYNVLSIICVKVKQVNLRIEKPQFTGVHFVWALLIQIYEALLQLYIKLRSKVLSSTQTHIMSLENTQKNKRKYQSTLLVSKCFNMNYMYFLSDYFKGMYLDWSLLLSDIKKVLVKKNISNSFS